MQEDYTPRVSAKTEATSQTQVHPKRHTMVLFHHEPHLHQPRNVNLVHAEERAAGGFNEKVAIWLTKSVGTMWTAYTFAIIAVVGLFAILGVFNPIVALLVAWASQTLIQLVLLPVIMVGQNVLGRKAELQADEAFKTTMSTYHDIEQIMQHLLAQDAELLRHAHMLMHLLEKSGIDLKQLEAEGASTSHLIDPFAKPQATTDIPAPAASTESEKQGI